MAAGTASGVPANYTRICELLSERQQAWAEIESLILQGKQVPAELERRRIIALLKAQAFLAGNPFQPERVGKKPVQRVVWSMKGGA